MLKKKYNTLLNKVVNSIKNNPVKIKDNQSLSYSIYNQLSRIKVNKNDNFENRMLFDIIVRQTKQQKLNKLINIKTSKINEEERIEGFNRLISDANRRIDIKKTLIY